MGGFRANNGHWLSQNNLDVNKSFLNSGLQGKMEYIWDNPVVAAEVEYRHAISEVVSLRGTYRFNYVSSDRPDPILSMHMHMNQLLVGIGWRL
jgi:hypothetical protein